MKWGRKKTGVKRAEAKKQTFARVRGKGKKKEKLELQTG